MINIFVGKKIVFVSKIQTSENDFLQLAEDKGFLILLTNLRNQKYYVILVNIFLAN